jgi:hypothetical protein
MRSTGWTSGSKATPFSVFNVTTNAADSSFAPLKLSNYGIHHHMSRKYQGQAIFASCHPREQHDTKDLDLDLATLSRSKIHVGEETVTVSRDQISEALAGWRAANQARP